MAPHETPRMLSPTDMGREVGMDCREVVEFCLCRGVPIFQGRINADEFMAAHTTSDEPRRS